jgi:hypothetical protein
MLEVDRKLKANALLPKVDLSYSYLSEPQYIATNLKIIKLVLIFLPYISTKRKRWLEISAVQNSRNNK